MPQLTLLIQKEVEDVGKEILQLEESGWDISVEDLGEDQDADEEDEA